ncbi:MAG TPA: hypothetical protein DCY12_01420 [Candidatus Atribacteria bacterium]|nr:hypothetical protein [Candidatus Atribacteria bacterium]
MVNIKTITTSLIHIFYRENLKIIIFSFNPFSFYNPIKSIELHFVLIPMIFYQEKKLKTPPTLQNGGTDLLRYHRLFF